MGEVLGVEAGLGDLGGVVSWDGVRGMFAVGIGGRNQRWNTDLWLYGVGRGEEVKDNAPRHRAMYAAMTTAQIARKPNISPSSWPREGIGV